MGLVEHVDKLLDELTPEIGCMDTEPVGIKLKDGAKPYCLTTTRKVPFPLELAIEKELKCLLEEGVIKEAQRLLSDVPPWYL